MMSRRPGDESRRLSSVVTADSPCEKRQASERVSDDSPLSGTAARTPSIAEAETAPKRP